MKHHSIIKTLGKFIIFLFIIKIAVAIKKLNLNNFLFSDQNNTNKVIQPHNANITIRINENKNTLKEERKYPNLKFNRETEGNKIKISIFYDTMCGDSCFYFKNSLRKLYQTIIHNFANLFEINIFPGALEKKENNYFNDNSNDYTSFTCKHGENECFGNAMHACAIKYLDKNSGFDFVFCYFDNIREFGLDVKQTSEFCLKQLTKEQIFPQISECSLGEIGKDEINSVLKIKEKVRGKIVVSPSVVINNEFNYDLEDEIESDTLGYLCKIINHKSFSESDICRSYVTNNYKGYFNRVKGYKEIKKELKKKRVKKIE